MIPQKKQLKHGIGGILITTEQRLIDANVLRKEIDLCDIETFNDKLTIIEQITNAPTVDAAEVVHSQWDTVFYESHGTLASYSHLCPVCKYFYRDLRFKGHNYCPDCGAKMDLEVAA